MLSGLEGLGNARLNSDTVIYGVLGHPVRQSKSPIMLNRAFQTAGVHAAYAAFDVAPERIGDALAGIRSLGFGGANVTIPHKVAVMGHLDEIDEAARVIGAVNTIVNKNGRLIGYNTDGIGYVRSLKQETGVSLKSKRILVLGAGGAARGVVYALLREHPASVAIANRTEQKALELAAALKDYGTVDSVPWSSCRQFSYDLIINTTPIGMHPNEDEWPADPACWPDAEVFSDLIYNPLETRFLQEAKRLGRTIHGGLGMFVYQGAYAFEYWTGMTAPVAEMRSAVLQSFEK
ncbi:shikimate dehydrogenase [Xylanibacillus composti]|uniref:Shikimate dehydrogenase (NADP(+)) n=1 Tax=Xylanibacillus composti TaxID=1572762 RepID=A0A8J4H2G1_9BACL|nr:shikimate dehydrogenase [Xylanibacillus composti]MDT9724475.1 shikimate dehydrogenase [Xylanibacillus composti]GIQ69737.1 shikimate dehydrogenase (NADP(+)) [Xylanibacillus composti]